MKFYIKGDSVGVVMTKTELAALYAAHGVATYEDIINRLDEDKGLLGTYDWTQKNDTDTHHKLRKFLIDNK